MRRSFGFSSVSTMIVDCGHLDSPDTKRRLALAIVLMSALPDDQDEREQALAQLVLTLVERDC